MTVCVNLIVDADTLHALETGLERCFYEVGGAAASLLRVRPGWGNGKEVCSSRGFYCNCS